MPFWRAYYHLVWGTKDRKELITPEIEPVLFQYLTNKGLENDINFFAINGWYEHVHIVCTIAPKHSIADSVKRLKGASSYYINQKRLLTETFAWQRGYGVFTLGESQVEKAIQYVENQKNHHQAQTTNSWLERMDVEDEGPTTLGLATPMEPTQLKEAKSVYESNDPFPF